MVPLVSIWDGEVSDWMVGPFDSISLIIFTSGVLFVEGVRSLMMCASPVFGLLERPRSVSGVTKICFDQRS